MLTRKACIQVVNIGTVNIGTVGVDIERATRMP